MPITKPEIPLGTQTLILSKLYYGILSKQLENIDIERYFSILFYISQNNKNVCQQQICDHLYIDKTAMVKILDTLEKSGLITRKVNPKDRREHFIALSKKGEKQSKEIANSFAALDAALFKKITAKDKNIFMSVLSGMIRNLEEIPKNDLFFNYKKTKASK